MPLKFTKNQTLILEIFFNKPGQAHYLRELARLIGKEPGVFQRSINQLVDQKILVSYYQANSRFFKLNQQHSLYKEFKNIFLKTTGVVGIFKKELPKIKGITEAFIYGSFASGQENDISDIDLFIIGTINEDKLLDLISKLEKKFEREINYILMTKREFKKKLEAKNSFLENVLSKKRIELI